MGIHISWKIGAARGTMGIHLSCQIGAEYTTDIGLMLGVGWEPIFIFTQKKFTNIRLKKTRSVQHARQTKIPVTLLPDVHA